MIPGIAPAPVPLAERLAAFRRDEAGTVRTDVVVGGLAVAAVLGILIMADMNSADPVIGGATEEAAAAAPARTVSSVGFRAPEPEAPAGGGTRQSYASDGYEARFSLKSDHERAILEAQSDAARAAEAAAGGPPPVAEALPEAAPASDATLAADEAQPDVPAADGG